MPEPTPVLPTPVLPELVTLLQESLYACNRITRTAIRPPQKFKDTYELAAAIEIALRDLHQCQNCESTWCEDQLTNPIPDLAQRVGAGEPMPSGECPDCRAVCHPIKP